MLFSLGERGKAGVQCGKKNTPAVLFSYFTDAIFHLKVWFPLPC